MNITYLIGNGFDLNLGLKTTYGDFIKTYKQLPSNHDVLSSFRTRIASDSSLWSNAELAFGKCTKDFTDPADFCHCHKDFCDELAAYLDEQEARLHFDGLAEIIPGLFVSSIKSYTKDFREDPRQKIQDCVGAISGGFTYSFISFNYTKTLDKCVNLSKNTSSLGKRNYHTSIYNNAFGPVLHVHGFTDKDMVLGVNDESQICNPALFNDAPEEYICQIIKRETNRLNEEHMDEKCADLVSKSDLIYIYGMSIGETDAIWWQRICTLLKNKSNARVILHAFDAPPEQRIRTPYLQYERSLKEKFVNYSNLPDETRSSVFERIHITSANIFSSMKDLVNHQNNTSTATAVTA